MLHTRVILNISRYIYFSAYNDTERVSMRIKFTDFKTLLDAFRTSKPIATALCLRLSLLWDLCDVLRYLSFFFSWRCSCSPWFWPCHWPSFARAHTILIKSFNTLPFSFPDTLISLITVFYTLFNRFFPADLLHTSIFPTLTLLLCDWFIFQTSIL